MITMCSTIYIIAVLALSAIDTVNSSKLFGVSNHHRIQSFGDDHFNGQSCNDSNVKLRRKRRHQELDSSIKSHHVPIYESTRLQSILRAIRAGDDANNNSKSKASKSSPTRHISTKQSHRRGTRTTGAGASRRNPSIFSKQDEDEAAKSWTTAALAGDMLNRQSSEVEKAKNNPMVGRLWAKLSDQGTLILKLAPKSTNEQDVYVELSEWDLSNSTISSKPPNDSIPTRQSIHMTQLTAVTDSKSDPFIPLEGIYGIYNLPCSGPHAILITESEEIYTSPVSTTKAPNSTPLLELRRIKSLEIVPLRGKTNSILAYQLSEEQLVEEARQLRLLRNSYKEHDFYFTVPRTLDIKQQSPVVQDVTHSLQRMFLDWSAESKIHGNAQNHWWTPYVAVKTQQTRHHTVDPRFFWNEQPALTLLRAATTSLDVNENSTTALFGRMLDTVIPVTSAFVGVERNIPVPNSDTSSTSNEAYDQVLISRRSKYRTGTRFTRRGADDTGAVANYAETEQICLITTKNTTDASNRQLSEIYSHVQTRGSIPLHWSSPADVKAYRPRVFIGVDPTTQARGLRDHLLGELWWYTSSIPIKSVESDDQQVKLAMVNLIDKHGDQGRLGTTFDSVLSAVLDVYDANIEDSTCIADEDTKQLLHPKSVKHVWYDFHAECKGGRWDKLSDLLDEVSPILSKQAYFCAIPTHQPTGSDQWKIASLQDGVVRTNCMDCLDRTNVVQSMFGRFMLYRMFHERLGLSVSRDKKPSRKRSLPLEYVVGFKQRPLCLPWDEGESAHRHLWADNADAISRLYAGTPALKGDFTRTGVRTKRGALDDGVNSIQRYYLNNFIDADRQEGMDLLVGSAEFNEYPTEHDEMSRVFLLQELADDKRRGYEKSHVRIKKSRNDSSEDDNNRKLTLSWLPGDLRHHMKVEALQSRSPLSSAAQEEDLYNAKKSSDFLMEVSTVATHTKPSTDSLEALHSIDGRVASARPWWAENDNDQNDGAENKMPYSTQKTRLVAMLILAKAPVVTAAILTALIAYSNIDNCS